MNSRFHKLSRMMIKGAMMLLRDAQPEDANALSQLITEFTGLSTTSAQIRRRLARSRNVEHPIVAELNGRVVGLYTVTVPAEGRFTATDATLVENQDLQLTLQATDPLSVLLLSSSAEWVGGEVVRHWQTADDSNLAGFDILRRRVGDAKWTLLTATPLPASGLFPGESYEYADVGAPRAAKLEYALSLRYLNGRRLQIDIGQVSTSVAIFLPIIK